MHRVVNKIVGKPSLVRVYLAHNFELRNFIFGLYQHLSGFIGKFVHSQKMTAPSVKQTFVLLSHIAYINYISIK